MNYFFAISWVICGVIGYGITFGHFQTEYPRTAKDWRFGDRVFAIFVGCTGPIGLCIAAFLGKHPMQFR